jgi:serine protease Do
MTITRKMVVAGALAVTGIAIFAALSSPAKAQQSDSQLARARALAASKNAVPQQEETFQRVQELPEPDAEQFAVVLADEGPSWLGVETHEVTSEVAKDHKLPAERGVVVGRVTPDSPAAKAGLKESDVITEIDGQRVEGAAQFRRMIHEIPTGRTVQLTVWRDGRAQSLAATLGKSEEGNRVWSKAVPSGAFHMQLPEIAEAPEFHVFDKEFKVFDPDMPMFPGAHPRLGIDAEDISGQLGTYFGAPDAEGVLVRDVNAGSPAEKAGLKAGDVITAFNGERVHSLGDLRQKLAAKKDDKVAKLEVLRNKSKVTLSVDLPAPAKTLHKSIHSTNI